MLKNYLITGFRNLRKHFLYSLINIAGLGLGLATCLLLYVWISHEVSYDRFLNAADRIHRSALEYSFGGQIAKTSSSPTALLPALKSFPEVEEGVRIGNPSGWQDFIVRKGDNLFSEDHFYFADSAFFDVFSYRLLQGDPATALTEPYTVVLTESVAKKYFGNEDPMGKIIQVNNTRDYTVTGVMQDAPSNSFLQFDLIGSFISLRAAQEEPIWWSANYQTFVRLAPGASVTELQNKTNELVKKALASELTNSGDYVHYNFTPLTDLHLHSSVASEFELTGDIRYVYIFTAIALLVLIIAATNYVNLSTARATERAKEVGLRKVIGAERQQLFFQFIGESILITLISFVFGLLLTQSMLPFFNDLTGVNFSFANFLQPSFVLISLALLLIVSTLAGAYPALVITSFRPAQVLKGSFKFSAGGLWLRKSLVVFQFTISMILIVGTIVIVQQLSFMQNKKLGYEKENTIVLPYDAKTAESYEALKTELTRAGAALVVGRGNESPVHVKGGYGIKLQNSSERGIIITGLPVDHDYVPAMNMEIVQGRNFTKADLERVDRDTVYSFIVNEAALKALFVEREQAIGTRVQVSGRQGEIVGVLKDFHFASLHRTIDPLVMFPESYQLNLMFVKLPSGDVQKNLEQVKSIYSSIITHRPFDYEFMDQQYASLYTAEQRMGTVFIVFACLAIIIACLGLLGLVSFSAAQKAKEIGVRKVLGATAQSIVMLIARDYSKLIAIAIVISLPSAYWIMTQWLSDFAYREEIGIFPMIVAVIICILVAVLATGHQVIKAATVNPAETLRSE